MNDNKQNGVRRYLVLLGTMIVQFGLGTLYTWSLFNAPLAEAHGWGVPQVSLSFSISTLALSLGSLIAEPLRAKFGEKWVSIACGIVLSLGLMSVSFINSLILLYILAGVVVGMADGIAYMMTLTNCIKWFPEKKGFISGIAVGCFGIGSFVFKYVNSFFIETYGVSSAFYYWGISAMGLVLIGSLFLKDAPNAKNAISKLGEGTGEFTIADLFRTKQAYLLFFAFTSACLAGLYVIGVAKDVGVELAGLTAVEAGAAVTIIALCNTAGRFIIGYISDYLERTKVVAFAFAFIILSVSLLLFKQLNYIWLLLSIGSMAFAFGGILSIFPAIVGEYFGIKNSSKNYGVIYQGFGIGGFLGGVIANVFNSLTAPFYLVWILAICSFFIMLFIQAPHK